MADLQAGVQALAIAIEQVYDMPQLLVEKDAELDSLISETGSAIKVSAKNFRLTFKDALPGPVSAVYLDNPAVNFPTPGSSDWQNGTMAPVASVVPIGWTKLAEIATGGDLTVVKNVVSEQMGDTVDRLKQFRDMNLCAGDGTGFLGTVTAVAGTTITLSSNDFGVRLLNKNMVIDVYNGATLRNSATIQSRNDALGTTQTITVDVTPAGTIAGDFIRVTQLTSGAPQFVFGLPYWNSNAGTGITVGLDRSVGVNNFIISNGSDAAQSQITAPLLRIPFDQVRQELGSAAVKNGKLSIHVHPAQKASYEALAGQMATIPLQGGKAGGVDLLFGGDFGVNGCKIIENIHAHIQRWDYLNTQRWGKIKWGNPPFWYTSEGRKVFNQVGTNGQITSGMASFMVDTVQYYVDNPKAQAAIYNAKQPAGY